MKEGVAGDRQAISQQDVALNVVELDGHHRCSLHGEWLTRRRLGAGEERELLLHDSRGLSLIRDEQIEESALQRQRATDVGERRLRIRREEERRLQLTAPHVFLEGLAVA